MSATKDQERQALKKIKGIVESLGEDSYIATAFDGVWELAEDNIENDFAYSCMWYKENYYQVNKQNDGIRDEFHKKEREMIACLDELKNELSNKESIISDMERKNEELENEVSDAYNEVQKGTQNYIHTQEQLEQANREIMKLKAMLFDLMFKDY